eukprot:4431375-Amphidinium_carterae.1
MGWKSGLHSSFKCSRLTSEHIGMSGTFTCSEYTSLCHRLAVVEPKAKPSDVLDSSVAKRGTS